jgi:hypothetical protein
MANLAAGTIPNQFLGFYNTTAGAMRTVGSPKWSSYYQQWYTLMSSYDGSSIALFFSPNGLNWNVVILDLSQTLNISAGYIVATSNSSTSGMVIDDSNGRLFFFYRDSSNFTLRYAYSSISNTGYPGTNASWTLVNTGQVCEEFNGAQYVKMSTTAASGIVAVACDNTSTRVRIVIVSAGATTNSLVFTATGLSNPIQPTSFSYEENGKIFIIRRSATPAIYNASTDIRSGWTTLATTNNPSGSSGSSVGNGYVCYINGSTVYYGTGSTFSSVNVNASSDTLVGIFYTGSRFVTYGPNGGLWISSNNTPVTWSSYNGIPAGTTRTISANAINVGQRVTAT